MANHTSDAFPEDGSITSRERESALNAALHVYRTGTPEQLDAQDVNKLLADADAIARFLNDGSLPA